MATNDTEEEDAGGGVENVTRILAEETEDVGLCEGGIGAVVEASSNGATTDRGALTSSYYGTGVAVGMSPLLANVALVDSFHGTVSSGDEPSTESRMCTEESAERMTSSTEGMVSLSEDSSGRDTYAQAHGVGRLNSLSGASGIASGNLGPPQHADTIELDESDEQMNGLLGSYREISIEGNEIGEDDGLCDRRVLLGDDTEEEVSNLSPDSGPASPLEDNKELDNSGEGELDDEETDASGRKGKSESNRRPSSLHLMSGGARPRSTMTAAAKHGRDAEPKAGVISSGHVTSKQPENPLSTTPAASTSSASEVDVLLGGLQGLPGLVLREGEMVSFVAEDLQEQIKRASPIVKRGDTPSFPGSRSSTPSLYKQALTPQLAPVDPAVLNDIETKARAIASSIDTILENLTGTLHSMSSLTVDCMETYHGAVCKTCDSIDSNIKAMYQLMAKFEELGNLMRPVYRLSGQIKEIKRLLDLFEHVVASGGS